MHLVYKWPPITRINKRGGRGRRRRRNPRLTEYISSHIYIRRNSGAMMMLCLHPFPPPPPVPFVHCSFAFREFTLVIPSCLFPPLAFKRNPLFGGGGYGVVSPPFPLPLLLSLLFFPLPPTPSCTRLSGVSLFPERTIPQPLQVGENHSRRERTRPAGNRVACLTSLLIRNG